MKYIANECIECMNDMEIMTEGWNTVTLESDNHKYDIINNILSEYKLSNELNLLVHQNDYNLLIERRNSLFSEKDMRKESLTKTGAEIARLWTLLRIPTIERENFQMSFKMNISMSTLVAGENELKRLFEIRTTSLARVIKSIRHDILTLWDECGIDEKLKRENEFPMYYYEIDKLNDSSVSLNSLIFTLNSFTCVCLLKFHWFYVNFNRFHSFH